MEDCPGSTLGDKNVPQLYSITEADTVFQSPFLPSTVLGPHPVTQGMANTEQVDRKPCRLLMSTSNCSGLQRKNRLTE
jgi:hypothetical protein